MLKKSLLGAALLGWLSVPTMAQVQIGVAGPLTGSNAAAGDQMKTGATQAVADPILLVEILSPSNEVETWANIWAYTTIPSVMEIVIVSSTKVEADLLRRRADGSWPEIPERVEADGKLTLDSVDFTVPLRDVYRTTALAAG